jgi:photosystem II stability/assembly factor-like uncharacterized protein
MKKLIFILFLIFFLQDILTSQLPYLYFLNPYPTGNKLNDIKYFNNNIGIACGDYGTILKTTNNGLNWITIFSNSYNSFMKITILDSTNAIIVGSNGNYIRTTNRGNSWFVQNLYTNLNFNNITFLNQNLGFISADSGVIFRTSNGGQNWNRIYTGILSNFRGLKFYNNSTGYAAGNLDYIIKTTNSGYNWSLVYSNHPDTLMDIEIRDSLNIDVVGYFEVFIQYYGLEQHGIHIKSSNGGINWSYSDDIHNYYYSINFYDFNTGFISGNKIMKTTNAGISWTDINYSFLNNIRRINIYDSVHIRCTGDTGIIASSSNMGNNWIMNAPQNKITNDWLYGIDFINENTGYIVGGHQPTTGITQTVLKTTNGGLNWSILQLNPNNMWLNCIKMIDNNTGYIGGGNNYFYKTTNGGNSWVYSSLNMYRGTYDMYFFDANTGIIVGGQVVTAAIKYTEDGGNNWENRSNNLNLWVLGVDFVNQNTGFISCSGGKIYKTTNRGINWIEQITGTTQWLYDIKFTNELTGFSCGNAGKILKTTNGGENWQSLQSNFNYDLSKLKVFNPNTILTIGSMGYILYSINGGSNWIQNKISSQDLNDMFFNNYNTGYIIGDFGTILKTTNGGFSWINSFGELIPTEFSLSQNYPNPFNPNTIIRFQIKNSRFVTLRIYDILGKEVATLVNEKQSPGTYEVSWDGSAYPSGVYFYKLSIDNLFLDCKKMIFLK